MKTKLLAAIAGVGAMLAGSAYAAFISGTISFNGGFDEVPVPPNLTCIVNCGTDYYDVNNVENVFAAGSDTGDFVGTTAAANPLELDGTALPFLMYTTDTGFSFTVTAYTFLDGEATTCAGDLCTDSVAYNFRGVVSKAGFDDTLFIGRWTANGTCLEGTNNGCTDGTQSASWSSSVVATGRQVPEPASLALFGLGLAGLGAVRRKKRAA